MNLINLLKDYKGSLYSLVHGEIKFNHIKDDKIFCDYESPCGTSLISFTADGRWLQDIGECILFPSKNQKQWNKFFKDGDIVTSNNFPGCVYVYKSGSGRDYYYGVTSRGDFCPPSEDTTGSMCGGRELRLANQDEINRLHDTVIKAGYFAIDAINLVKAQFQEGDYIRRSGSCVYYQVLSRTIKEYVVKDAYSGNVSTIMGDRQWKFTKISSREGMICVSQYGVIYLCESNYNNHSDYDIAHCYCKGERFYISNPWSNFHFSRLANVAEIAQFIHIMKLHHCDFVDNKLTFIPFSKGEPVLFRNSVTEPWIKGIIVEMNANKFTCVDCKLNMSDYTQCIPYNTVTKGFVDCKSENVPEFYKTW